MRFADWLKQARMTQAEAGRRLGVTQGRVSQIALDGTDSLKIATAIEDLSEGQVTVRELLRAQEAAE